MTDPEEPEQRNDPRPDAAEPHAGGERKRKRRKKKRARAHLRSELDADGRCRPAFLLDFPRHPELERIIAAYEAGNFAYVREQAPKLAERTDDPAVRDAALELRHRIDPDPLAKYLLFAAIALLAFLIAWTYLAHH